jgi:beta-mannosidase
MARDVPLSGNWRAAPADEPSRRDYPKVDFDDRAWSHIDVPGHWRSSPAFADIDGPVLHRHRFELPSDWEAGNGTGRRSWLVFDGIFYTSDVWMDGSYVGDTEGYFFPHAFEVTDQLMDRREHVLALEVSCSPQTDRTRKRNLTGVFQHWDLLDQSWNPGGIWRPARIEQSGPVRIRHCRMICRDATDDQATITVRAVLDTTESRNVELRTRIYRPDGSELLELAREHTLAEGENRLEWAVAVPDPDLWWPWSLGEQPRYRVDLEVLADDRPSDSRTRPIGLRRVEMRNWIFSVNGHRLFLKGSNQGPTRMALAEATPEELRRDVQLARETGLDLLRIHGHISRPELYEAADEQGLLLWQDLPLQWGYARSTRGQARRQAREAVDLLGHHASVAIWCGHNEPLALDVDPVAVADARRRRRLAVRAVVAQVLPSWNKSVLDHSIATVLAKNDGSRPVVPHSGILPHPPLFDGTDSHLYFGWYWGDERDLPKLARWWPRLARFVTEFGAQAVPDDAAFLDPARWPDLDWERAARHHSLQKVFFDRHVPPGEHATFEAWQRATQRYQADVVRYHVEALRLLKYRPCGGFAQFCFADGYPSVTWSVLDHRRRPKLAHEALARACAPVVILASRPPSSLPPGATLQLAIHAVNDRPIDFGDMIATAHLSWSQHGADKQLAWRWQGSLPADGCERIGSLESVVPPADAGLVIRLELRSTGGELVASNRYQLGVG